MKYEFIKKHRSEFCVGKTCQVLQILRSAYYDWIKRLKSKIKQENRKLLEKAKKAYKESRGTYGIRRITAQLKKEQIYYGENGVAKLVRENP